ncbi:arsenate reductase ArsC [bacterium]|nr:arsenate reductase ArsC [bacterium]
MSAIPLKVLFLCTGNSARSQMAEALLRHIAGDRFEAFSAGTEPKPVHPLTLRVLEEAGVSTAGLRSKNLREYLGREFFSYIVVVCSQAADNCPTAWPGVQGTLHYFFDDPAAAEGSEEEKLQKFREVRDQIKAQLEDFVARHAPAGAGA